MIKQQTLKLIDAHPLLNEAQKKQFRAKIETMTEEEIKNLRIILEANLAFVQRSMKIYENKIKGQLRTLGNIMTKAMEEKTHTPVPQEVKRVINDFMKKQGDEYINKRFTQISQALKKESPNQRSL